MSWSGIKHEPEIITVAFTGAGLNNGEDCDGYPAQSMNEGAYIFDEHGCELGVFNIESQFSVPSGNHPLGPTAEHPDRDFFGWPAGFQDHPVSIYNNVDEAVAAPSIEAAAAAVLYESAERADPSFQGGLSWYAACETCEGPDGPQEVNRGAA